MKAAIYARKSQDDSDRNDENKSVVRQVENARKYAQARGWMVEDHLIFRDDGSAGAEYVSRRDFARLMTSLKQFDVLVMSEASRLGRDMTRNAAYILDIIEHGKRIFYYLTDEEEKADTPEQKILATLRGYASEVERLKAGQRSRDALIRKAERGYNAGGIVYGYDNLQIFAPGPGGEQVKTHTDYRINEQQADVLRRIFRTYAAGHGHVSIAKTMNGDARYAGLSRRYFDGVRPQPPRKGTGSWAPSSIRAMLYNERYTGIVPFGEYQSVYRKGTKARLRREAKDVLRTARPDLRIIADDLWREVQERLKVARKTYTHDTGGVLWGRPGAGIESKYLLTGFGECGCCARNITMVGGRSGSPGHRQPSFYYGCACHQNRGRTVCDNDYRARMEEADALVLNTVKERVLTPAAMDYVIDNALQRLSELRQERADLPEQIEAGLRKERRQRDNFLALVADGKAPPSVLQRIAALDASIADKERELADFAVAVEQPSELDLRRVKRTLRERLGGFDELLHGDVPLARQALRKLLAGRIEFLPERSADGARAYRLRFALVTKPLVEEGYIGVASPRGFEPRLLP